MSYSLQPRPRSSDFDLVGADSIPIGQVIRSDDGFSIYLLGDFESLLGVHSTPDEAIDAFEDWAASNTTNNILILPDDRS